jgi:hypothetical protein
MKDIKADRFTITRLDGRYLVSDYYGGKDVFTAHEIRLLIDLWQKSFTRKVNYIRI